MMTTSIISPVYRGFKPDSSVIAYVVISIAASMLPWGLWYLTSLVRLALFVLAIINAVSASKGEMKPLPVVGGISILK